MAVDGTKLQANASRHSTLCYEHAGKIAAPLRAEMTALMAKAEAADLPEGLSIPTELARREQRLAEIARPRAIISDRARERHAREQADYEAKMAVCAARTAATGKKPGDQRPAPPVEGPGVSDTALSTLSAGDRGEALGGATRCAAARAIR